MLVAPCIYTQSYAYIVTYVTAAFVQLEISTKWYSLADSEQPWFFFSYDWKYLTYDGSESAAILFTWLVKLFIDLIAQFIDIPLPASYIQLSGFIWKIALR